MRRKFLSLISLTLAIVCCFLVSGCSPTIFLTFKNNFVGGVEHSAIPSTYREVLTYDVDYTDVYDADYIKKSAEITDDIVAFQYENGTFIQEFEILDRLPSGINSDIDIGSNKVYHIKSTFNITVKYRLNGATQEEMITVNDKVESQAYFLPASFSFAPIYSKTQADNHFLQLDAESNASLRRIATESETVYNQKNYKMITDVEYFVEDGDNVTDTITAEYEYQQGTLIDNALLFFAIRNFTVNSEAPSSLPTVSYSYGTKQDLYVRNHNQLKDTFNISYTKNGDPFNETGEVKFDHLSFMIGSTTNSGAAQYLKVQSEASANLPSKSLVLEYAETLTTFSSFKSLGALVYTLKSVEVFQ